MHEHDRNRGAVQRAIGDAAEQRTLEAAGCAGA